MENSLVVKSFLSLQVKDPMPNPQHNKNRKENTEVSSTPSLHPFPSTYKNVSLDTGFKYVKSLNWWEVSWRHENIGLIS